MRIGPWTAALVSVAASCSAVFAEEPNENFFAATILPPGVLVVEDELGVPVGGGTYPDTIVGYYGLFASFSHSDSVHAIFRKACSASTSRRSASRSPIRPM